MKKATYVVHEPKEKKNSVCSIKACADAFEKAKKVPIEIVKNWHIQISEYNSKVGNVFSVSIIPVGTCINCGVCAEFCYAVRSFLRMGYKTIEKLYENPWFRNTAILLNDPDRYFTEIDAAINEAEQNKREELAAMGFMPEEIENKILVFFRWHVSGDILRKKYFAYMCEIADNHKNTRFLAFTKAYEFVNDYIGKVGYIPENLSVPFSIWSGLKCDNKYGRPEVHLNYADPEKATYKGGAVKEYHCNGNCEACASIRGGCFYLNSGEVTLINQH